MYVKIFMGHEHLMTISTDNLLLFYNIDNIRVEWDTCPIKDRTLVISDGDIKGLYITVSH